MVPSLGARWNGGSTSVVVRSPTAERVELCTRTADGGSAWSADLRPGDDGTWSLDVDHLRPGDQYGFRVHGPGHDPRLLLLDLAGLEVAGEVDWARVRFGEADTAPHVPWSVVVDPTFNWRSDAAPATRLADSVVYELNVRSFTATHPRVHDAHRGTYLGLTHPAVVDHLVRLGVTAVELLPVQHFVTGRALWQHGLRNLWGYDPIGWFAPHAGYAAPGEGPPLRQFQLLVRTLHEAGIEVILDVVFNHTGELDDRGPTLCHRGLDDAGWYRHTEEGRYEDTTGCHNTVDLRPASNRRLVVDCLRSWVELGHVDGFRFDLATTLLRGDDGVDLAAPFLADLAAEPALAGVKLVAEPWDAAPGGYRLGGFPPPWAEWNDRYRDDVRDAWRGAAPTREGLATRLAGSSDLFADGRPPSASVNFVTAHDGFTLADLVAYEQRRNDANGEDGNDGASDNHAWNCGVEGPTDDPAVRALRARQQRNLLATLLLSRGVPMLTAGDEIGRSQGGNNNAYCQDNEVSWLDWQHPDADLLAFTRRAIALRRSTSSLTDDRWLTADDQPWWNAAGDPLAAGQWWSTDDRVLVLRLEDLVVAINTGPDDRDLVLPPGGPWLAALDTTTPTGRPDDDGPRSSALLPARSVLVLRSA